jgi:hypothetical protein
MVDFPPVLPHRILPSQMPRPNSSQAEGIRCIYIAAEEVEKQGEVASLQQEANAMRWLEQQVYEKKMQYNLKDNDPLPRDDWGLIALLMSVEQEHHLPGGCLYEQDPWPKKNFEEVILTVETHGHSLILDRMQPNPDAVAWFKGNFEDKFDTYKRSKFASIQDEVDALNEIGFAIRCWSICKEQNRVIERCVAEGLLADTD